MVQFFRTSHYRCALLRSLKGFLPFLAWGLLLIPTQQPAQAGFIGSYSLDKFTVVNTNADGTAFLLGGTDELFLIGGNSGSGLEGLTDVTIAAPSAGTVSFDYYYASMDSPGYDSAGYLLAGGFLAFADSDGQSGSVQFPVLAGQKFGFRIYTADNTGEPGMLTVSNFSAPGLAEVPEPSTFPMLAVLAVAAAAFRRGQKGPFWRKGGLK